MNVTAIALRRWASRSGLCAGRGLTDRRRRIQLLSPTVGSTTAAPAVMSAAFHVSSTERVRAESMASERRRLPRVASANDLIVREARDDLMSIVLDTNFGEPALAEALKALRDALEYNLPGGKRSRLLAVVQTYELLADEAAPQLHLACLVGWCVELLQCYFLILDDIMDGSTMRRAHPCWYTRPDVGLRAINDALFFDKALGWVLRQRLRSLPCYLPLLELFHEGDLRTVLGQEMDMVAAAPGSKCKPTIELYWATVTFKTAFYSFALPIRAGMLLAGVEDSSLHEQAQEAALALGRIFQVRDDYIDCFGSVEEIGKVGTDIVDGKYSWLLVTALQVASPKQAETILAHIGRGAPGGADEAAVKAVYRELDLPGHYAAYRECALRDLDAQINRLPPNLADVLRLQKDALLKLDS
uniref:Farnesyl pyrophosphate synthase n=1 Tax=Rhipicephalus pulchellus TaxID=72859 RepID=L7LZQ1_RHIPC